MQRPPVPNPAVPGCGFHHVAIRTAQWDRSLAFWQAAMGFSLAVQWGEAPRRACMPGGRACERCASKSSTLAACGSYTRTCR